MDLESIAGNEDYQIFLLDLKTRIETAQTRAALAVNHELVLLYWSLGRDILARQQEQGWGAKVVERLSIDLRSAFPEMKGFSSRNLKYMRAFAEAWTDEAIVQAVLAQITWYHNIALIEKISTREERLWYARQTVENGWSRNVLVHQIESRLYERQGKAVSNFDRALPSPLSELAQQLLKDPYNFDFLTLHDAAVERDLERGLLDHIRDFLLELGQGFAFVGSQVHLIVSGKDYYIDLLFYHVKLHCYVIVDLKAGEFQPEFAGKMNFYAATVDHQLRDPDRDERSIGLLLCKSRDRLTVEYALYNTATPIGVSEYQLSEALPEHLKGSLPTIAELEAELERLPVLEEDTPEIKPKE